MINMLILLLVGLAEGAALLYLTLKLLKPAAVPTDNGEEELAEALGRVRQLSERVATFKQHLVPIDQVREKVEATIDLKDILQAERARTAITQVELEAVELRLRELEEVERELEASEQESREELRVLKQREQELRERNEQLKNKISESREAIDQLVGELELNDEQRTAINRMQEELSQVQDQIEELLEQVAKGNDQYFLLKRRYDALDIEYAQLYEKFIGD